MFAQTYLSNISLSLELLPVFQKLQQLDDELCHHGQRLLRNIVTHRKGLIKKHYKAVRNHVYLAGSLTEHGTIARIFEENQIFSDHLNREVEADLNYDLFEITEEQKSVIEDVPDKIGYVHVRVDLDLMKSSRKLGWVVQDDEIAEIIRKTTTHDGLLQPYKVKEVTLEKVEFKNTDHIIELLMAAALNKPKKDIEITKDVQEITGATVASNFLLRVESKLFLKIAFDSATLITLPWWPSIGKEWKWRKRNWPSQEKIDEMSSVCYLIGKPFDTYDIESTEFRYSFGHIERELVNMRSKHQNLIYLIFKIVLYKWVKPINPSKISSYIVKTIMLWTCEQFPPDHKMWDEDFASMTQTLSYLLKKLQEVFQDGYLECYFVKEIDIIKRIPLDDKKKASEQVKKILENLNVYLPFPVKKELNAGHEILDAIKSTADVFEEWERKDYSRLIRQPKLIQDSLQFYIESDDFKKLRQKFKEKLQRETDRILDQISDEAKRFEKRLKKVFKF